MSRPVLVLFSSAAVGLLALGCGAKDPGGPPSYALTGTWEQGGDFRDSTNNQSHIHLGSFTLTQIGSDFSGTGEQSGLCHTAQGSYTGPLADPTPFAVSAGKVIATSVSFDTPICHYQGGFDHGNPDKLVGNATCTYTRQGVVYHFAGTWGANRYQQ